MERPAIKKKIRLPQPGTLLCCVLAGRALPAAAEWAKPTECAAAGLRPVLYGVPDERCVEPCHRALTKVKSPVTEPYHRSVWDQDTRP